MKKDPPTLSCVTEFIVDCLHKTAPIQETGYPLIRTPNIGKGRFYLDGVHRISQETYDKWTIRAAPQKNDLIMAREAPAGNVAIIKSEEPHCLGQRTVHIRPNPDLIDPDFLTYFLLAPKQQAALLKNQIGVHVGHVNMKDIRKLPLENLPPMEEQKRRAEIIASYDDLIENNKRRIELLEDSARQLYKEWFVRFRFPGHEHGKIVAGVPEGWKFYTYGDISETVGGGTPSTGVIEYWEDGDITWFVPKDLTQNDSLVLLESEKKITKLGLQKSSAKLLPPNTIMMSSRASIGYFGLYDGIACTNQGFISVIPNDANAQMYLLYNLMSRKEEIIGLAGGTTYKEINKTTFRAIPVLMPPSHLLIEFQDWAKDAIDQARLLMKQKKLLVQARDLLLPKLMSGEIAV